MPLPQKRLIPGLLLMLALVALAAPPLWWSQGNPPVIDITAPENNKGPANIGQAKHMAKSAIDALRTIDPTVADLIQSDLIGGVNPIVDFNIPNPKTPEWIEKQKAPLLIGQLKAIAAPFYTRLNAAAPAWLEAERIENASNHPNSIFPWTAETTDDANKAIANIGQLKAVFSLHFQSFPPEFIDEDGDGMDDRWEIAKFGNLNQTADGDFDIDGLTNVIEFTLYSNPTSSDTSKDGIPDGWAHAHNLALTANNAYASFNGSSTVTNLLAYQQGVQANPSATLDDKDGDELPNENDAEPLDGEINWQKSPEASYVWVEQLERTGATAVSRHGHIHFPTVDNGISDLSTLQVLWDSNTSSWVELSGQSTWSGSGYWSDEDPDVFDHGWKHIDGMNDEGVVVGRSKYEGPYAPVAWVLTSAIMKWQMSGTATDQYAEPVYIVPGFNYIDPWGDLEEALMGEAPRIADDGTVGAISSHLSYPDPYSDWFFTTQWVTGGANQAGHSSGMEVWAAFEGYLDGYLDKGYRSGAILGDEAGLLVEHDAGIPETILHYRNGAGTESLEGLLGGTEHAIRDTDIGRTPATGGNHAGRVWFSVKQDPGNSAFLEKRAGGSGVSRWHKPASMVEGAIRLNARGEAITPTKVWRNGTYTPINDLVAKPESSDLSVTKLIDLASNGIILAEATEGGVTKAGLLLPIDIVAHKRGTIDAPGSEQPKGNGEYGYETVMMENADSEDNTTGKRDCATAAVDKAKDDDFVKIVLHYPGLKIEGASLELKHEGIAVDAKVKGSEMDNPEDAIEVLDTGSRMKFYREDGTLIEDPATELKIADLKNPGSGYLAKILDPANDGKLTLFIEGKNLFGFQGSGDGNLPRNEWDNVASVETAMEKLGGARLKWIFAKGNNKAEVPLLVYRGGFLLYRQVKDNPGVVGTFEFWDGKGRIRNKPGGYNKEFQEDETDMGEILAVWLARSGQLGASIDYRKEKLNGHTPPGWWWAVDNSPLEGGETQTAKKWLIGGKLHQASFSRWKQDDEADTTKRYTHDWVYEASQTKDAGIGKPTNIEYKFRLFPIPGSTRYDRTGLLIHPDGKKDGTAGCIGIQSYQDCLEVKEVLINFNGLKIKVNR